MLERDTAIGAVSVCPSVCLSATEREPRVFRIQLCRPIDRAQIRRVSDP